jgi:hypothetical protein
MTIWSGTKFDAPSVGAMENAYSLAWRTLTPMVMWGLALSNLSSDHRELITSSAEGSAIGDVTARRELSAPDKQSTETDSLMV